MREAGLDAHRYYRAASWAGPVKRHQLAHIESDLIKHYHVLEKGLSMSEFRPRSGTDILKRLIVLTAIWRDSGGADTAYHYQMSLASVRDYDQKHRGLGIDVSDLIPPSFLSNMDPLEVGSKAGAKLPMAIEASELAIFDRIAKSRHSVRQFEKGRVPGRGVLADAVEIATTAPSVCNRQTWRVHFYQGDSAQKILSFQNGNRGFGHLIPTVAVITSDMRLFGECVERYQSWIDGGMFSMNLILALHARGVSSVALNWSRLNRDDSALRQAAGIPPHERIIMLMGCGYAPKEYKVTCSPRSPVSDFVTWHSDEEK